MNNAYAEQYLKNLLNESTDEINVVYQLLTSNEYSGWVNARGTGDDQPDEPGVYSWKEYWEKYSGNPWPLFCCCEGCIKVATDGAHIRRAFRGTKFGAESFIVPFCSEHNPRTPKYDNPVFNLKPGSVIVRVNVKRVKDMAIDELLDAVFKPK